MDKTSGDLAGIIEIDTALIPVYYSIFTKQLLMGLDLDGWLFALP